MTTLRESAPGEYGGLRLVSAAVAFNTPTVDLETLAVGDVVIRAWVEVTTAFNAATTNTVSIGDGTTATKYVNAQTVAATGTFPAGGAGQFVRETATGTLRATYSQTGAAATAGAGRVYALVSSAPL